MRRTLAFICKKPCPFQRLNRFVGFETYGSASAAILPSLPDDVPALVDACEAALIQRYGTGPISAPTQALVVTARG